MMGLKLNPVSLLFTSLFDVEFNSKNSKKHNLWKDDYEAINVKHSLALRRTMCNMFLIKMPFFIQRSIFRNIVRYCRKIVES